MIILLADTALTIVIMDKSQYIQKAKELVEGKKTYIPVNTNPIQKFGNLIKRTLNDLTKKG